MMKGSTKVGLPGLKEARKAAGLSQRALGDEIGISRVAVCNIELCNNDPSLNTALAIVASLRKHGINTTIERLADR